MTNSTTTIPTDADKRLFHAAFNLGCQPRVLRSHPHRFAVTGAVLTHQVETLKQHVAPHCYVDLRRNLDQLTQPELWAAHAPRTGPLQAPWLLVQELVARADSALAEGEMLHPWLSLGQRIGDALSQVSSAERSSPPPQPLWDLIASIPPDVAEHDGRLKPLLCLARGQASLIRIAAELEICMNEPPRVTANGLLVQLVLLIEKVLLTPMHFGPLEGTQLHLARVFAQDWRSLQRRIDHDESLLLRRVNRTRWRVLFTNIATWQRYANVRS